MFFFSEECRLQTPRKMAGSIFRRRGVAPTIKDGETVGATNRVSQLITVCIYIHTYRYIYNVYYINDGVFECI
jgi:transglutaminase-like putative cysteine protease